MLGYSLTQGWNIKIPKCKLLLLQVYLSWYCISQFFSFFCQIKLFDGIPGCEGGTKVLPNGDVAHDTVEPEPTKIKVGNRIQNWCGIREIFSSILSTWLEYISTARFLFDFYSLIQSKFNCRLLCVKKRSRKMINILF